MMYYFNNCRAYDHEELYGAGAFYDLRTTGQQATQATKLRQGDQCVVVTRTTNGYLVFTWFAFQCERLLRDNTGAGPYRVFFGTPLDSATRSQDDAVGDPRLAAFFDKNGNFKRRAVTMSD